jgi:hypothetical protein
MRTTDPRSEKRIPEKFKDALLLYANYGVPTGNFLRAILSNDLIEAVGRADHLTIDIIPALAFFVSNHLPKASHGSREKYDAWVRTKKTKRYGDRSRTETKPYMAMVKNLIRRDSFR